MSFWHLDFAQEDGLAGFLRLDLRPEAGTAWYWTYLVVPGLEGLIVVRDHDVPLPRQGLEIRAEGLWAELWCETPEEHWTFGLEAFGLLLDDPQAASRSGGEIGERVPVGLDLEWEIPDRTHGEILIGRMRHELDGWGAFFVDTEPPEHRGELVSRVLIPEYGERALVRTADGFRWTRLPMPG